MNQDDTWLPITYRDFYDVPRMILVEYEDAFYLFDCPFNYEMDDYPSDFTVYRLEPAKGRRALESGQGSRARKGRGCPPRLVKAQLSRGERVLSAG